ncbi:MAG TPA: tetratricopeptide repeat protein [Candidatus Binataceae bacterium]|nr:tetratricopeptide repeat protein [Candidatus Binataceae bacterium]
MATSTHRPHISRKELRQPDEFVSFFDAAGEYVATHLVQVILAAMGLLALILFAVGVRFYLSAQERDAAEAFYAAVNTLDHKDYAAAAAQFAALANEHPHSRLGRLAPFYVANANLAQQQPAKARDALKQYLANDSPPAFRELALMQLGVADEDLGDYAGARESYAEAAALKGAEQPRAALNVARLQARAGEKAAAIASYQRFIRENPFSPDRGTAVDALASLGVAAPASPQPPPMPEP